MVVSGGQRIVLVVCAFIICVSGAGNIDNSIGNDSVDGTSEGGDVAEAVVGQDDSEDQWYVYLWWLAGRREPPLFLSL